MSTEDYVKGTEKCGLKAGDFVRLIRKAQSFEGGWNNVWPRDADAWIGHILYVERVDADWGVKCIWHKGQFDEDWFCFPYFVLEKAKGPEADTIMKKQIFNPGDIVRVMRSAHDNENGWCNIWVEGMNEWIGKTCRVVHDTGTTGIRCEKLDNSDSKERWCFPSFVLEKVSGAETTPEEKKMLNIGDYVRVGGSWQPYGATGRVEAETAPDVWKVKFDTPKEREPEWWCYPAEALERIEGEPAPEFVPFETRVLVRDAYVDYWLPAIYGFKKDNGTNYPFGTVGGIFWAQCIPYEGNEHLLGTSQDPKVDN